MMITSKKATILAGAFILTAGVLGFITNTGQAADPDGFQIAVNDKGAIRLPDVDYRKDWVSLGAWAVAAEEGTQGSEGIHTVYTQPGTVEAFRETGKFPDGSILIKELFSTTTDEMTTGTVSRVDKTSGWFVMIKDATNRYPDNKLWGAGWGWAYFDAKDRINTTTTDYEAECLGCHVPVKDQDWVYIQGYPVLRQP
jgi:hypothetical protein